MRTTHLVFTVAVFAAGGAHAQRIESAPTPALQAERPAAMRDMPSFSRLYGVVEGLPPADPQAADIYRADPKLTAGFNVNANLAIETTFVNPNHREGLHAVAGDPGSFLGSGPRLAQGVSLGTGGYDLEAAARLTVPVDDRLSAIGKLGIASSERQHHTGTTNEVGAAASLGATYKLNRTQTLTAEIPLGAIARKEMSGSADGYGARLKFGF